MLNEQLQGKYEPIERVLWCFASISLILIGIVGVATQLFIYHPYIICILGGILGLLFYAWICIKERGLVGLLPPAARAYLERVLHQPLFDVMYFNSSLTGSMREWTRMFLLQMDLTEAEISEVTRGMSPEFLHTVLHENIIDVLPPTVQSLLIPAGAKRDLSQDCDAVQMAEGGAKGRISSVEEHGAVVELLREKQIQKESMLQHPSLRPVTQYIVRNRLQEPFYNLQKFAFDVASWGCGLLSITSLCFPVATVVAVKGNIDALSTRTYRYATACLLVSTSFSLVGYLLRKRYSWLSDVLDSH